MAGILELEEVGAAMPIPPAPELPSGGPFNFDVPQEFTPSPYLPPGTFPGSEFNQLAPHNERARARSQFPPTIYPRELIPENMMPLPSPILEEGNIEMAEELIKMSRKELEAVAKNFLMGTPPEKMKDEEVAAEIWYNLIYVAPFEEI